MRPKLNLDRFIPNRSAMDFDYARGMLTQQQGRNYCPDNAYRKRLAEALGVNRNRILAFRDKPKPPRAFPPEEELDWFAKPNRSRYIPPAKPDMRLDAPGLADDDHRNLLDWGSCNVVAIGLENRVCLRDASNGLISQLVTCEDDEITGVSWAPDGCRIAVGLFDDDQIQLWDTSCNKKLTTFSGCPHRSHVSALAWNGNHILTTGGSCCIVNTDVRVRPVVSVVQQYRGHKGAVRGLKWSPSGRHLASGGNDNLVYIWDRRSVASSNSLAPWLHSLKDHTDAVKALAWCPFQDNLLASGGGDQDQCIKFWNTCTAACLNSVDTGSEVCSLLWNNNQRELLSSHGLTQNQLTLWNYPSMDKIAELSGHTSRVLYTAQSPDGCTVASAAGGNDEALNFWNVFGDPKMAKAARKSNPEPFAHFNRIR